MSSLRLQSLRNILSERLNAVAEEIFGEVKSIVEEYCEENNRLRNVLQMVISPELKLTRIDDCQYNRTHAEKTSEPNSKLELEISEPLIKKPKEEETETDIRWGTEQQENNRLRNVLQMVIRPEIKLTRIDDCQYNRAHAEKTSEPNSKLELEMSEPLIKKPKEEEIETDISWGTEQQEVPTEAAAFIKPDCVKNNPEEEDPSVPCVADLYQINVVDYSSDSSATVSDEEENSEQKESFSELEADSDCSQAFGGNETVPENQELQTCPASSKMNKKKPSLQKTMLKFPRIMPYKPFMPPPPDCQSFFESLKEAFKDFPEEKKPLITTMDLTTDVELVDCALGKVPKGCPLSYHFPLPSSQDYKICDDAPPQPQLPLAINNLEPVDLSTLSAEDQERVNGMQITWEAAHHLELSTRECKESIEELRKLRLTCRFKDICKLQPGRKHANDLIYKLLKGPPRSKMAQIEEELKAEALREYCRHLCVNWYPCGLVVHPNAPWLGATPHGLVYDPNEQNCFGLVYVKCVMLPSFANSNFLFCRNGALQLKRHHLCYWHIQGEMMVTGTTWCDLLVYSREDILVQRIYRDTAIIKIMKEKLDEFFFSYYLQSLVMGTTANPVTIS